MDPVDLGLRLATTALSAKGELSQGKADERAAQFKAKTQYAAGTRKAYEAGRESDLMISNARAAMAQGGGMASDAGALEELSRIAQEGSYNAQAEMYEAETNADITRYEGKLRKYASRNRAIGTALSGASGIYQAYNSPYNKYKNTKKSVSRNNVKRGRNG